MKHLRGLVRAFLLTALLVAAPAYSEPLSLDDFLEALKSDHPFVKAQLASGRVAEFERDRELGDRDWRLEASGGYGYREPSELGLAVSESQRSFGLEASLSKKIWETGGEFNVSAFDRFEHTRPRVAPDPELGISSSSFFVRDFYQKGVFLGYNQPLLKNRGGKLDSVDFELKNFDVLLAKARSAESSESFLLEAAKLYLAWAELDAKKKILQKRVKLSQSQLSQTRRMTDAGVKENEDLFRSEESFWAVKRNLALIDANSAGLREQVGLLMGRENGDGLQVKFDLLEEVKDRSMEELKRKLLSNSRVLKVLELSKERTLREIESANDENDHQLDLDLSAGLTEGDEDTIRGWEVEKPDVGISLNYSRSLGTTGNKAESARLSARKLQIESEYQSELNQFLARAGALAKQLKKYRAVIEANRKQLSSAVNRTRSEQQVYEQGRGELNFVIQSQDSEQSARFQLFELGAEYQSINLELEALVDELFEVDLDSSTKVRDRELEKVVNREK